MMRATLGVLLLAAAACGGDAAQQTPARDTTMTVRAAPAKSDSAVRADSVKRADSLAKAAKAAKAAKQAAGKLRDSAFGPKFKIDEKTGKVTPIKRP